MWKKRQKNFFLIVLCLIIAVWILVFIKNNTKEETPKTLTTQIVWPQKHIVGSGWTATGQANGIIVATNSATIIPSIWGIVQTLSCKPWELVHAGDLIAKLVPAQDLQTENLQIQKDFLGRQVGVLSDALNAWLKNVDIQISSLGLQKEMNQRQLTLLQQNKDNLEQQKRLSANDISIQRESLQTQLDNLIAQQKIDTSKTDTALSTQIQWIQNSANAWLSLVNKTFGITNPEEVKYAKPYVGGKDPFGVNKIENDYGVMNDLVRNLDNVSPTQASIDIQTIITYFTLVANVINNSISDSRYFTQPQIDALYSAFNNISNGLLQAKNGYDATVAGLGTIGNTYDSQITALQNQLASLDRNKKAMSDISIEWQINGIQSQINSLQLALDSYDNQLATLQNSKNVQTQQTNWQLLTVQQNYKTIQNNLEGESLYSPIDGIVKMSSVSIGNKVGPTTPVCVIGPKNTDWLKIQFFSTEDLSIGQEVSVYIDSRFIGIGNIDTKGSSVDAITQNYSYELLNIKASDLYKEWMKVTITFSSSFIDEKVRIPLSFLIPRLDGHYVIKEITWVTVDWTAKKTIEVKVEIGEINNDMVHVLSGLQIGDIIQK